MGFSMASLETTGTVHHTQDRVWPVQSLDIPELTLVRNY